MSAIENAAFLRNLYNSEQPYFERNPYTTMDFLIKSLFKWGSVSDVITVNNFQIHVLQTQPTIELEMTNLSTNRQIIQKQHFQFNRTIDFEFTGGGLFDIAESRRISIVAQSISTGFKLKFPCDNQRDFTLILC